MKNKVSKKNLRQRGYSLIEIGMGVGIMTLAMSGLIWQQNEAVQQNRALAASDRLTLVSNAAQDYVRANYQQLVAATTVGGPALAIPVTGINGPNANLPTLQGGGFVSTSYIDRNAYGQSHAVLVRQTSAGNLEALTTEVGGQVIRDEDLGRIVNKIGGSGGAILNTVPGGTAAGTIQGQGGGWSSPSANWASGANTPTVGHAMTTSALTATAATSDFLYRTNIGVPEANKMHTSIDMGTTTTDQNSINNAYNVVATNDITAGDKLVATNQMFAGIAPGYAGAGSTSSLISGSGGMACANGTAGCKFWVSQAGGFTDFNNGWITYEGSAANTGLRLAGAGNNLDVGGNSTMAGTLGVTGVANMASNVNVGGDVNGRGNVLTNGLTTGSMPAGWSGVNTVDTYSQGSIGNGLNGNLSNWMGYDGTGKGHINTNGDVTATGIINGGEILSNDGVYAANYVNTSGSMTAQGDIRSQNYLYGQNGISTQGAGWIGNTLTIGQTPSGSVTGNHVTIGNGRVTMDEALLLSGKSNASGFAMVIGTPTPGVQGSGGIFYTTGGIIAEGNSRFDQGFGAGMVSTDGIVNLASPNYSSTPLLVGTTGSPCNTGGPIDGSALGSFGRSTSGPAFCDGSVWRQVLLDGVNNIAPPVINNYTTNNNGGGYTSLVQNDIVNAGSAFYNSSGTSQLVQLVPRSIPICQVGGDNGPTVSSTYGVTINYPDGTSQTLNSQGGNGGTDSSSVFTVPVGASYFLTDFQQGCGTVSLYRTAYQ